MRTAKYPGLHARHRHIKVGPKDYRCSCGVTLANSEKAAINAMHQHRDGVTFDEWIMDYIDVGDCWLWTGRLDNHGYGRAGQGHLAHRYVYERLVRPIGRELTLDHLCRVPPCVNPDHLQPVSSAVNVLRGYSNSARNARKTSCARGLLGELLRYAPREALNEEIGHP